MNFIKSMFNRGTNKQPPRKLYEKSGGFSYDPPSSWKIGEMPGFKYKLSFEPSDKEIVPNINVIDQAFSDGITTYVDMNIDFLEKNCINLKIIKREDFYTQDDVFGVKLISEADQGNQRLRHTTLLIGLGERMYVVTGTTLAKGGAKYDSIFAKCLETFRIH